MIKNLAAALGDALHSTPRPPAFAGLSYPKYSKEFCLQYLEDGTVCAKLTKYGWEYKHRGPRPKVPHPSDPAAVRDALAQFMPQGVTIQCVEDCGTYLRLTMEVSL